MSDLERIAVIRRTVEDCIKYSRTACTWGHEADIKFLLEKYDALEARCAALLADVNQDEGYERLKAALQSIASNTCCDKCQEAALVARRALGLTLETFDESRFDDHCRCRNLDKGHDPECWYASNRGVAK